MSTSDKKVDIFLKKFLTQQQITDNFFDFLEKKIRDTTFRVFSNACLFTPNPEDVDPISSDTNDTIDIVTPMIGTDGPGGNILSLDPLFANNVPFENETGVDYFVGLRFVQIPRETEINVRTGKIKYTFLEEGIGERADPNVVVDDLDETLTITVDSVCEVGVSNAGRRVLVFLKDAKSQVQAFEELTVIFTGGFNKIETTTAFGQQLGSISTDAADYEVILLGPTIKRNTDLSIDSNILFIGKVTGDNGTTPSVFDFTGVCKFFDSGSIQGIVDSIFAFLVSGGSITWDLDASSLTWSLPLQLILPHRGFDFSIAAQTVASISDGDVLYIVKDEIGGVKPIIKVANGGVANDPTSEPIAVRIGNNIYFRNGSLELEGVVGDPTVGRIDGVTEDILSYMGAANESDSDPDFLEALGSTVKNFILSQGDNLTKAIKTLETRPGAVDEVRVIDLVNTSLPVGATVTTDGEVLVNGDRVVFVQAAIEGVYQLSGVGTAIAWDKLPVFKGAETPTNGKLIVVLEGSIHLRTLWERCGAGLWRQLSTSELSEENTGFHQRFDSAISFVDVTRTFTIQPQAPATFFDYLQKGKAHRINVAKDIVIPDVEGLHFIFFDGEALASTQVFTDDIIESKVFVATVSWDAINNEAIMLGDERHGLDMDGATHKYLHFTQGVRFKDGLALGFDDSGDGSADTDVQVSVGDGTILDEDLPMGIIDDPIPSEPFEQILDPIAEIPVYFRNGASGAWRKDTANTFPVKQGAARIKFNLDTAGTWTQPDAADGNFVAMWLFATNNINEPVIAILGQREDTTLNNAQANNGFETLQFGALPSLEMKVIFRLIFETQTAFGNTPSARLAIGGVQDLRTAADTSLPSASPNDHGNLGGLTDKDHRLSAIDVPVPFGGLGTFPAGDDDAQKLFDTLDPLFAQLQMFEHPSNKKRVVLTGASITKTNNTILGKTISNLLVNFPGVVIDFESGQIFNPAESMVLDTFTPVAIPSGEFTYYSVNLNPDTIDSPENTMTLSAVVQPGPATGAVKATTPRALFIGIIKVGQVVIEESGGGGGIADIPQADITQLRVSVAGGGIAGGGISGEWRGNALNTEEFDEKVFKFQSPPGVNILTMYVKVPQGYVPGSQIKTLLGLYSPSASNRFKMLISTVLIRKGVDAIDTTTNVNVANTGDIINTLANQYREGIINLTDAIGEIQSTPVSPGDLLKLLLTRTTATVSEDAADIRFVPSSVEVNFG